MFNDDLCQDLKSTLLNVEHGDTGSLLLKDFYRVGLRGHWNFTETEDYLRVLGALDESNPKAPRVIVPNYDTRSFRVRFIKCTKNTKIVFGLCKIPMATKTYPVEI